MTNEERSRLDDVLALAQMASERARRISESTQNPTQDSLNALETDTAEIRRRLYWILTNQS
jgi:hypothetical protein